MEEKAVAEATEARRLLAEAGADFLSIRGVELTLGKLRPSEELQVDSKTPKGVNCFEVAEAPV